MPIERLDLENSEESDILVSEHRLRYKFISEFLTTEKVLDIACGSGYGSYYLSLNNDLQVTGVDLSSDSISKAKENYQEANLKFQVANALSLPFEDNSFDIVVSLETIEHFNVSDQKLYLAELKRVLTPVGKLWLSTPNAKASKHKNPWHLKELDHDELQDMLMKNFCYYNILKQGTALATIISSDRINTHDAVVDLSTQLYPKYFLAVASDDYIADISNVAVSLNAKAFIRLDNHPLKRISDAIYHPLSKMIRRMKEGS
jgi:ubiquinone/menaquinone biosynthesis C-methylase UbiE